MSCLSFKFSRCDHILGGLAMIPQKHGNLLCPESRHCSQRVGTNVLLPISLRPHSEEKSFPNQEHRMKGDMLHGHYAKGYIRFQTPPPPTIIAKQVCTALKSWGKKALLPWSSMQCGGAGGGEIPSSPFLLSAQLESILHLHKRMLLCDLGLTFPHLPRWLEFN